MTNEPFPEHQIVLVRHAETTWSLSGRHTGRTDLELTEEGRRKAAHIARCPRGRNFGQALTSPLRRAADTCAITGYAEAAQVRDDLMEWDYGDYEGLTTADIRQQHPGWVLWIHGAPGGESPEDVRRRVDAVVDDLCNRCESDDDVVVFSHGHLLRALAVRWVGLPIRTGRLLRLGTGTVSTLCWKREIRVIDVWNSASQLSA